MLQKKSLFLLLLCLLAWMTPATKASAFDLGAIGQCISSQATNLFAGEAGKNSYIGSCLIEGFGPDGVDLCRQYAGGFWSVADCNTAYASVQSGAQAVQGGINTAVQTGTEVWKCLSNDPIACANDFLASTGATDPNLTKVAMLTGQAHFDMGIESLPDIIKDAGVTTIVLTKEPFVAEGSDLCRTLVTGWYSGTLSLGALAVSGPDGRWLAAVPACGKTTYTIKPTNAAFNWTPGERTVTVGGDVTQNLLPANQPAAEIGVAAPAAASQANTSAGQAEGAIGDAADNTAAVIDKIQKENTSSSLTPSSSLGGEKTTISKPFKKTIK